MNKLYYNKYIKYKYKYIESIKLNHSNKLKQLVKKFGGSDKQPIEQQPIEQKYTSDNYEKKDDVIELLEFDEKFDESYNKYKTIVDNINRKIEDAVEKFEDNKQIINNFFEEKKYDKVKELSNLEIINYPIVSMNDIQFRIFSKIKMSDDKKSYDALIPLDPFYNIRDLESKNNFIIFYKVVPEKHLCSIKESGLDTKFGGVNGASANIEGFENLAKTYDRGKMFISYGSLPYEYNAGFKKKNIKIIELLIKIPKDETVSLNLTVNNFDEWFIAGTQIHPKYIFVKQNKKFIKIAKYNCETKS